MKSTDFRKKSPAVQRELREVAVRAVVEGGKSREEAGNIVGAHRLAVSRWVKLYRKIGKKSFMLWTREAVGELIKRKYDIILPLRTISDYLKRWGFTPQRPKKRAYEQQPEVIKSWLDEIYPQIQKRAKAEGAEIHWGDETAVCSNDHRGRGFSPKGVTPVVSRQTHGHRINMISAISNFGTLRFMIFDERCTADVFISFLSRFIQGLEHKAYLIVDNHPVHKAKKVRTWLTKHQDKIELFFLPPYAPEHNPDEYLNNAIKQHIGTQPRNLSKSEMARTLRSYLHSIQKNVEKIKSFFSATDVQFAQ